MPVLLKVKNINAFRHKLEKLALTTPYILSFNCNKIEIYTCIKYKLYLIKDLKANMPIGNNILYIKVFFINLLSIFAHI